MNKLQLLFLFTGLLNISFAQDDTEFLELLDERDLEFIEPTKDTGERERNFELSEQDELDDLSQLKDDVDEIIGDDEIKEDDGIISEIEYDDDEALFQKEKEKSKREQISKLKKTQKNIDKEQKKEKNVKISEFEVGSEEANLINYASKLQNKIPANEWNEIAKDSLSDSYKVMDGDTLWRISKRLFGTGFYYSKVWSLNPYITNPHQIEPGMLLSFNTGSEESSPEIRMGSFMGTQMSKNSQASSQNPKNLLATNKKSDGAMELFQNMDQFAEDGTPEWLIERERLKKEGIYFQTATNFTYADLQNLADLNLVKEYENYEPPRSRLNIVLPETYDETGFDSSSVVRKKVKEGFALNTFLTTNIVQDFGFIEAGENSGELFHNFDRVYLKFDQGLSVSVGDKYSIYSYDGIVDSPVSERKGRRYTIKGHVQITGRKNDLWVAEVSGVLGTIRRSDRLTVFTPKIKRILKTFNKRTIEAAVMAGFNPRQSMISYGDVVYLDRGRADGVELGNIFEIYSFTDNNTEKRISLDPTYKVAELTVVSITENFSTALVSLSKQEFNKGTLAITKTQDKALRESRLRSNQEDALNNYIQKKALDELDVELNLDSVGEELLRKADQIQLSDEELDELERQERENSIINEHEKDLRELDRLEDEIATAEGLLNEAVQDKDKMLEQEDLNQLEAKISRPDPDAFESLEEIETEVGKKYMDEDLNNKENPYGLTEFDLEEIDELLNTKPKQESSLKGEVLE